MSADNRICIMLGEDELWHVWHGSLSDVYSQPPYSSDSFPTREEALSHANNLASDCVVLEGGIGEIGTEEQVDALTQDIEDLAIRLRTLHTTGSQWTKNFN